MYISDNQEIAFAELLSGYALKLSMKHPLQKDADFMGMSLDDYVRALDAGWANQVKLGCLPAHWRDRRHIYQLTLKGGGW